MKTFPKTSIVITVKNEARNINRLLDSIFSLDYPEYEVILVDGGSTDGTFEIINSISRQDVKVMQAVNSTPAEGRNKGLEVAEGEIIAFTDGDCIVRRDWLKNAVKIFLERKENIGCIGGPIFPYSGLPKLSYMILNSLANPLINASSPTFSQNKTEKYVNYVPASNAIFLKEAIEKVGGFSPDLRFCEDVDLCYKIRKAGYKILFSPNVAVEHNWKVSSFRSLLNYMVKYGAGRAISIRKKPYLFSILTIIPSLLLISIPTLTLVSILLNNLTTKLLFLLTCSYGLLLLTAAILSAWNYRNPKLLIITFLTGLITHMGYGAGFLLGLIFNEKIWKILK